MLGLEVLLGLGCLWGVLWVTIVVKANFRDRVRITLGIVVWFRVSISIIFMIRFSLRLMVSGGVVLKLGLESGSR